MNFQKLLAFFGAAAVTPDIARQYHRVQAVVHRVAPEPALAVVPKLQPGMRYFYFRADGTLVAIGKQRFQESGIVCVAARNEQNARRKFNNYIG